MVSKLGAKWACAAVFVWVACSGFANAQGSLFNEKGALLFDDRNLNSKDLPNMVSTYHENEMRFKRDFVGKRFLDVLPFRSATENMFLKGMYTVGFGTGSLVSDVDCTITSPAAMEYSGRRTGKKVSCKSDCGKCKTFRYPDSPVSSEHLHRSDRGKIGGVPKFRIPRR